MNRRYLSIIFALVLVLAACSSGADEPDSSGDSDTGSETTTQPEAPTDDATTTTAAQESESQSTGGSGSATLTIGDETYEFDNYYCFQGGANTGNDRVSFSSGARGEVDGTRVQMDASIQDVDEGDAMDGDSTIQSVSINDIEDFENPSVSWEAVTGFFGAPDWVIVYDGSTVSAEALFDDGRTDEIEEVPGTLTATCP